MGKASRRQRGSGSASRQSRPKPAPFERRPFEGLEAALDKLAASGFLLAVCTNKLEWLAVRLLDALGLSQRFATICGGDTFGLQKPDPEMLRRTVARAGGGSTR